MERKPEKPELKPTCVSEAFGDEISDENRLTENDIEKYIAPTKKNVIDPGNLPFKFDDNHTGLDKKFPMYISKVLEFYEQGGRYKEFRNILKKQKRKEEKQAKSPMPSKDELFGSTFKDGKYIISFD